MSWCLLRGQVMWWSRHLMRCDGLCCAMSRDAMRCHGDELYYSSMDRSGPQRCSLLYEMHTVSSRSVEEATPSQHPAILLYHNLVSWQAQCGRSRVSCFHDFTLNQLESLGLISSSRGQKDLASASLCSVLAIWINEKVEAKTFNNLGESYDSLITFYSLMVS